MDSSSSRPSGERITSFEGLRGYAVTLVFMVHFVDHYFDRVEHLDFNRFGVTAAPTAVDAVAFWAWSSHYGVDLFFLLSGFLIFRLVARPDFDFGRFLWQRLQRLYPAFAVALLLYVAYHGYFWNQWHDWRTLLQNAVFLQGIFELGITAIIVPSWSLSFEWLFYLTTPVLLMLLRRGRGPLRPWHVLAAAAATLAALLPQGHHYARFVMFFAGGLLGAIPDETARAWIAKVPERAIVVAYVAVTTFFVFDHDYMHFSWPYSVACLLLVAKATYGSGALARIFRLAPLRALGNISYSFYLLHGLVLIAIVDHLGPILKPLPAVAHFGVLLAMSFAASVAASLLFFRSLERPYFQRRSRHVKTAVAIPVRPSRPGPGASCATPWLSSTWPISWRLDSTMAARLRLHLGRLPAQRPRGDGEQA